MNLRILSVALAFSSVLLTACDKEIGREQTKPVVITVERSCTYHKSGMCMDCGASFSGKYDCSLRFKPGCSHSGKQAVELQKYDIVVKYESGKQETFEHVDVLKELEQCK